MDTFTFNNYQRSGIEREQGSKHILEDLNNMVICCINYIVVNNAATDDSLLEVETAATL